MDQDMKEPKNRPQPLTIWLESVCSSVRQEREISPQERTIRQGKDEAILALLAKLSLHYWRPDFTPQQAKQLYGDYVHDLSQFAFSDVSKAIEKYRQDGANRFFPTVGALIDLIVGKAEFERLNPGAPDRATTLARARSCAIADGRREMHAMLDGAFAVAALAAPDRSKLPDQRGE